VNAERLRSHIAFLALVVGAGLWDGCSGSGSDQTGSGSAFAFLTVDSVNPPSATSNLETDVSTAVCVTLRNNQKNPTVTTPTSLDDIQVTSYTVTFRRLDGGTPPGPFTFNTAIRVPAGAVASGASGVSGNTVNAIVVLVPVSAKHEPPLRNPPPRLPLSTQADVVFTGRDGRGQRLSGQASLTVAFVSSETAETPPTTC
jgi:hypothetical protein